MITLPQDRPMRSNEASEYLLSKYGLSYKPTTLAKLRCVGGGPRFRHASRFPLYAPEDLDAWAAQITSPLKASTSDTVGA